MYPFRMQDQDKGDPDYKYCSLPYKKALSDDSLKTSLPNLVGRYATKAENSPLWDDLGQMNHSTGSWLVKPLKQGKLQSYFFYELHELCTSPMGISITKVLPLIM